MKKRKFELNHLLKWQNTLDKWQKTLDKCSSCSCCYEHCPIFKYTRWETESPRAKLTMICGLLSGKIEPSKYMADKIFSCFNCHECVTACSSGVPLTEIFTDARADFAGTEFDTTGIASIMESGCANCLTCVRACPYDARYFKDKHIVTDSILCQSCGICTDLCPDQSVFTTNNDSMATNNNSIPTNSYGIGRVYLNRQITSFLEGQNSKVIVFGCNWSFYPDLEYSYYDLDESPIPVSEKPNPEYTILVNVCEGRLTKPLMLDPFLENAWGVLVACCPDGECEHNKGNVKVEDNVKELK
ncbi:MAG: hydrogenase iron-sulfur subunit, partial [Desulfamplus sp.]|nr:hydrogenase iron-sulfur subunit [Desulfamplus sp.]